AGHVAKTGETINIPEAYEDPRFNPAFDKKTGYRTKTILTMPMKNGADKIIGVTQVLNKLGRKPFNEQDENLLSAFSSLAAIALENAQLYEDVLAAKNLNESILENIHNGVLTINPAGKIITANDSVFRILGTSPDKVLNREYTDIFSDKNPSILDAINQAQTSGKMIQLFDTEYINESGVTSNINLNVRQPSKSKSEHIGQLVVIEDITKEKRMQSTLSQYVTKEVADQILKNEVSLQGKRQKVTILFSDIRSFTSLSEKTPPEGVVELLNEYFDIMIDIIFKYEGTLDKFIGDAIMAVFGAPIMHEDDSHRALNTAIDMIRALNIFNEKRKANGKMPIDIGIGLSAGEVLAGNIGSEKRMEYTVIGDPVNLASRLEGLTKQYPHKILLSEFVYEDVKEDFDLEYLDVVNVKGKDIPVKIYGVARSYFENTGTLTGDLANINSKR
ncbi:MAG: PAS domain S-box protein, partial [Spirochaetota bacterium]|nr:PAS domain S-box protein [Spirochaetota bacterium]